MAGETEEVKKAEKKAVEPPAYMVMGAMQAVRKGLNTKQRTSSFFQEAPTLMGKVLRRGVKLLLTEAQMKVNELKLKRLWDAHAIEVYKMEDGKPVNVRKQVETEMKALKAHMEKHENVVPGPSSPPPENVPVPPGEGQMTSAPAPTTEVVPPPVEAQGGTEVVQPPDDAGKVETAPTDPGTPPKKVKRSR